MKRYWSKLRLPMWFALSLWLMLIVYVAVFNHTDATEIGIARNLITGNTWKQEPGSWHFTAPWVLVANIDTRPMKVGIGTAGRGYDYRLIEFVPEGWSEFVQVEGFHYYWWYNRLSYNYGHEDEYRGMADIMRGYAYCAKQRTFFKIISAYETNNPK